MRRRRRKSSNFARTARKTKKINISPKFTRGGIRL